MIETRGTLGADRLKGITAELSELINQEVGLYKSNMDKFIKIEKTENAQVNHGGKTNMTPFGITDEGENFHNLQRFNTYKTSYVIKDFTGEFTMTDNAIQDNTWKSEYSAETGIGNSYMVAKDQHVCQLFVKGFTTTYAANFPINGYGDGKPLFSTIHTRADGGTAQSNASATGIDLTESNLNLGLIALAQQLTDVGTPVMTMGNPILVVPEALKMQAIKLTQSELTPETANNAINYYKGAIADVVSIKWLGAYVGGSDTAWFLINPTGAKLYLMDRQGLSLDMQKQKNRDVIFTGKARWALGFSDWRNAWGSKGDGGAYAG